MNNTMADVTDDVDMFPSDSSADSSSERGIEDDLLASLNASAHSPSIPPQSAAPSTPASSSSSAHICKCPHLTLLLSNAFQSERFLKRHRALIMWGVNDRHRSTASHLNTRKKTRRKYRAPECGTCTTTLTRPFVCLECSFAGCWKRGHITDHLEETGHDFAVDLKAGSIICAACDDVVYHPGLEAKYNTIVLATEEKHTRFQHSKLGRQAFKPWTPNDREEGLLKGTTTVSCHGRRGLLNLGASCYLNVILQSLIHNPLLRNYFMSDKHPTQLCTRGICMCCEMDKLFSEMFAPDLAPHAPISFLHTLWRASLADSSTDSVAGYAQHDAHEVFITLLNQIHSSVRGSTSISCVCIVHTVFGAQLQSDVKCGRCETVRSTTDPMLDISLELGGGKVPNGEATGGLTLDGCLRRYTSAEELGPKEQVHCQTCGQASENATRRLSIRRLPPVLCFQFKRFEHGVIAAQKIDTPVRFPATLDMSQYTSLAIGMKSPLNAQARNLAKDDLPYSFGPEALYEFELFAVVNHEGQMDTGHYTNFARHQDEWYKYDDEKVIPSTLGEALQSRAYMVFYVKKHLDYKPYQTPSYVLKSNEIEKGKALAAGASATSTPALGARSVTTSPSKTDNPNNAAAKMFPTAGLPPKPNFSS